jgi:hypothetical protein
MVMQIDDHVIDLTHRRSRSISPKPLPEYEKYADLAAMSAAETGRRAFC